MDTAQLTSYVQLAMQLIGFASVVAAITPTPVDDGILKTLKGILNIIAMNVGQAKNAK
jgi:hypothetical protein